MRPHLRPHTCDHTPFAQLTPRITVWTACIQVRTPGSHIRIRRSGVSYGSGLDSLLLPPAPTHRKCASHLDTFLDTHRRSQGCPPAHHNFTRPTWRVLRLASLERSALSAARSLSSAHNYKPPHTACAASRTALRVLRPARSPARPTTRPKRRVPRLAPHRCSTRAALSASAPNYTRPTRRVPRLATHRCSAPRALHLHLQRSQRPPARLLLRRSIHRPSPFSLSPSTTERASLPRSTLPSLSTTERALLPRSTLLRPSSHQPPPPPLVLSSTTYVCAPLAAVPHRAATPRSLHTAARASPSLRRACAEVGG